MKLTKILCMTSAILAMLSGCKDGSVNLKPNVSGKAGEVIVVANKKYWEGESGTAIRSVLAVDYPFLPQKEPSFTLINIPENAFTNIYQIHRNILILQIDEEYTKPQLSVREDVWSTPQTIVSISAPTDAAAARLIDEKKELLFNALEQAERNRVIRNSVKYEEVSLRHTVSEEFWGSPYFPQGYSLKKKTNDFIWISYETTYINQGIFIYRIPYKDSTSLQLEHLIAARNEVLEKNVPGMLENSYMITSNQQLPGQKWIRYKKRDFIELRGLWEVQNDFMGGPFVSHIMYDPKDPRALLVLDGFVYAPRYDKRNYLRQVESILYSFKWNESED